MRLFLAELIKLISNKTMIIGTAVLFIVNLVGGILIYQDNRFDGNSYSPLDYKEAYEKLPDVNDEEAFYSYMEELAADQYMLANDVYGEVSNCLNYPTYVSDVIDNAKQRLNAPITSTSVKAYTRYQAQIISDYESIPNVRQLPIAPSKGIRLWMNNMLSTFLTFIFMLLLGGVLVLKEHGTKEITFYATTYYGGRKLGICKYLLLLGLTSFISVLLYLTDMLVVNSMYGLGDLLRPIQSVGIWMSSTMTMTVGEGILYVGVFRVLAIMMLGTIFYWSAMRFRNTILVYLINILVVAIEMILYQTISCDSSWHLAKHINIYAFMNAGQVLHYHNLLLGEIPISDRDISFISMILLIVIFASITFLTYEKNVTGSAQKVVFINGFRIGKRHSHLLIHEGYKSLFMGKILWVYVAFILFSVISFSPMWERYNTTEDNRYQAYLNNVKGEVTADKLAYLKEEELKYKQLMEKYENNEVSSTYYEYAMQGYSALSYLKNVKTPYLQNVGGWYIRETGYEMLIGAGRYHYEDLRLAFLCSLVLIYVFAFLFTNDYQNQVDMLIMSCYNGKKSMNHFKIYLGLAFIVLTLTVQYAPNYISVLSRYGLDGMEAPANSLAHLSWVPSWINLRWYLIGRIVGRLVGYVALMFIMKLAASRLKQVFLNCVLGIVVVLIPLACVYLDLSAARYFGLTPLLLGV